MKRAVITSANLVFLILMFSGLFAIGQTPEQVRGITSLYNQTYLQNLATQSLQQSTTERMEAVEFARARNIPISFTNSEGRFSELQRVLADGTLIYYQTNNTDAAHSTRTDHINSRGSMAFNLDGQNMMAYVWDGGHPRVTHQEFKGVDGRARITIIDANEEEGIDVRNHATHVTGTISASGFNPLAKGMAPKSKVKGYKWNNDLGEATMAVSEGMLLSNHSYSLDPTTIPVQWFGAYREDAHNWDNLMYNAPYYLMVKSAGNLGLDNATNTSPLARGFDKLSGFGTSKNNLVVASANDAQVDAEGNLIAAEIAANSSQGPTDDLRIKPDITGNGVGVYSSYANFDSHYGNLSGTSMAAPNVTGSLLLLQQHYHNVNGFFMRAATLKGLALHTADDAGPVGPDAVWGWGLLNAKKAAETITENGSESLIQELVISQGQTITITVDSDGVNDLMASISWTDRPGVVNSELNSPMATLINDLDIRIEKEGVTYYPWRLTAYNANAKDGDNTKDPYERVDVENATGTYTITITHKGTLVGGSQAFSLIVTGIQPIACTTVSVPENIEVLDITGTSALVSWDMVPATYNDLRYKKASATEWIEITDVLTNNYQFTGLDPNTEYELQLRSKCFEGEPSAYSAAVAFSTLEVVYCESHSPNANSNYYISSVKLNTLNNTSTASNYSDFTDLSTELVGGQRYTFSVTTTSIDAFLASYSVWIDYNGNGRFNDPGEQIFTEITVANTEASGSFTVPVGINPSSTRMRVSMINDEVPAGPCDILAKEGEVEDYTINLRLPTDFIYENDTWRPTDPAGVCTSMDNIQIVNGTAVFSTNIFAKDINIASGASLYVEKVLTIAGNLTNYGELVFTSNAMGNGELAAMPDTSLIIGNATVERYMSNNRSYRMVSSAVTTTTSIHDNWQEGATAKTHNPLPAFGTHITGSIIDQENGFDGTLTGNPSMFIVNVGTQQFEAIGNTDVNSLTAGMGYLMFIRGDRSIDLSNNVASSATTLRATGALVSGEHTQRFLDAEEGGFLMFGNPYQSAVDITSVFANSNNVNANQFYLYDPNAATHGSYITVDLTEGSPNQFLQPGQAAQVMALGAAEIVFNETDKAPGNFTPIHRSSMLNNDALSVQLYTTNNFYSGGPQHDSFVIRFNENNDNRLTLMDAVKPMNFYENIGVDSDGTYLSIERRKMPQPSEIYQLYSAGYQYSNYTMKLSVAGLNDTYLYLQDQFTGETTLLESGENVYSFTVDANNPTSLASDRFAIRAEARLKVEENSLLTDISLFPNPLNGDTFYIYTPKLNGEKLDVGITDLSGRKIYEETLDCLSNTVNVSMRRSIASGVYLVTLTYKGESHTCRLVKE